MADLYLDHGAYATNIGATPTWGTPQEGDGSALAPASAASIGSILMTAVPTSGTISVCGVTVSTTSVIGAASADAAADQLATNINATTTAVAAGVAVGLPQLRNLVFARGPSGGAPAGTCQIMMRVGSATLNNATNANAAIATTFTGTPTLTQFVGGSGGCWGWAINSAAIGASSSIAVGTYGLMVSKPMVWTAALGVNDLTYCRTGSGKSITLAQNQGLSRGNVGFPLSLIFDTNTKWTGDSGTGVFTLSVSSSGTSMVFRPDASGAPGNQVVWHCLARGNLNIQVSVTGSGNVYLFYQVTAFVGRNIKITESASPGTSYTLDIQATAASTLRLHGCDFDFSTYARANLGTALKFSVNTSTGGLLEVDDCDFRFNLSGTPADGVPLFQGVAMPATGTPVEIIFRNNRFTTNSAYKVKLFSSTISATAANNVSFLMQGNYGLALDSAALGFQNAANYGKPSRMQSFVFVGDGTSRHQRVEHWNGIAEWNPNAATAYPTLAALQPDGTAYSIRMYWLNTAAQSTFQPFAYRSTLFNRLTAGARTIIQHLFFDTTRGIDGKSLGIEVRYVDTSDIPRVERTLMLQNPVASGSSWTNAGSYSGFGAQKLTVTTAYSVKQNTEVSVDVVLVGQPPGSGNADVYVDPEFSIT